MMFDDIQGVNVPTYVVKDYRESIEAVKKMQGGLNVAKLVAKTKSERLLVDHLVQLADSIETLLKAFPRLELINESEIEMYLAYVKFATVFDKKSTTEIPWAAVGTDSEDIYQKALKYGTEPYFISGMFELNKDWK